MSQYPAILIVGSSGSGKSSSLKNLPKESTAILNIERKILPFKEAMQFSRNKMLKDCNEFDAELTKSLVDPNIHYIVIESFTSYVEAVLALSRKINKGYDIYNFLNARIASLLQKIKDAENKWIIMLSIDELVELIHPNGSKTFSRRCEVKGREWEAKVEKEFTIVLFTEVRQIDKDKPASYHFITNNDGTNSSKSPQGMFSERLVDNDVNKVVERCRAYYELPTPIAFKVEAA